MNKLGLEVVLISILLLLMASGARAQVNQQEGELRIYHRATQINTVANREFKDAKGRVVKIIYYTGGGGGIEGPYQEELLREQSIHVYEYDDNDCRIKSATYAPGMTLVTMSEAQCWEGTGTPRTGTMFDARGVKQSLVRYDKEGSTDTVLYFDAEGEKVISIWGETPADVDLVRGWGKEVGGFVCGIAANREKGRQRDLEVWVTVKNVSNRRDSSIMVSPIAIELRDSFGRLIEPKADYAIGPVGEGECPANDSRGVPFPGSSQLLRSYNLGEIYDRIAPGTYSFTVKHCLSSTRKVLVSNTIFLEVVGQD